MSLTLWDKIEKEIQQKYPKPSKRQNDQDTNYKTQSDIIEIIIFYLNNITHELQDKPLNKVIAKYFENKNWTQIITPYIESETRLSQNPLYNQEHKFRITDNYYTNGHLPNKDS